MVKAKKSVVYLFCEQMLFIIKYSLIDCDWLCCGQSHAYSGSHFPSNTFFMRRCLNLSVCSCIEAWCVAGMMTATIQRCQFCQSIMWLLPHDQTDPKVKCNKEATDLLIWTKVNTLIICQRNKTKEQWCPIACNWSGGSHITFPLQTNHLGEFVTRPWPLPQKGFTMCFFGQTHPNEPYQRG